MPKASARLPRKRSAVVPPVRRRDRAATVSALVAAAESIFAERGYETATTRAIARRAGYSEALIQNYFNGKEGLLLAVIQQEEGGPLDRAAFFARPLCATMEQEAHETLTHIVAILATRAARLRIVLSRVLIDQQFRDEFNRVTVRNFLLASLQTRFARYGAANRLPPGFDAALASELLISLAFQLGFIDQQVLRSTPTQVTRRIAQYAVIFDHGIIAAAS